MKHTPKQIAKIRKRVVLGEELTAGCQSDLITLGRDRVALLSQIDEMQKAIDELDGGIGFIVVAIASRGEDALVEEFRAFYKPEQWLGSHRAAGAFLGKKLYEFEKARAWLQSQEHRNDDQG